MYDPYWKNNGPRSFVHHHNKHLTPIGNRNITTLNEDDDENNDNDHDENNNNNNNKNNNKNNNNPFARDHLNKKHNNNHKHVTDDSSEWNMLPMIKEDPATNRIYRMSRVVHDQQNIRERHKRSASMGVVKFSLNKIFVFQLLIIYKI